MRIKLDERIIKILETILNGDGNYASVNVDFKKGEQVINTIYITDGPKGRGQHLLDGWNRDQLSDLDSVLALAQSVGQRGSNKSILDHISKLHAEKCKQLKKIKGELKDLQKDIGRIKEAVDNEVCDQ